MITLEEINELRENNKLDELIVLNIKYKDSDIAKPLNDALIDTMENLGFSGNVEKVEEVFMMVDLNNYSEDVLFKLFEVQAKYSDKGPLIGSSLIDENCNDKIKNKIESSWIDFIDRQYKENKTSCEVNCFIYTGIISNKVSLKCIDTLAKLGEFSSIGKLIVDRFPYITEEFRSEIEKVIKKYDKGIISEIPSILKKRTIVKSEKDMLRQ